MLKNIYQSSVCISAITFLAGAFTIFGFAPFRYYFLIPILLGVLLCTIYLLPKKAVKYAYLWGLGAFITHCYWINTAINVFGGVPKYISIPLSLLLPAYLALYPMLAVWLALRFKFSRKVQIIAILPMTWVLMEFIRERFLSGFGWGTLGYSQAANSPLIGYASLGGILLVTYVLVLITALLFYLCIEPVKKNKRIAAMAIVLLIVFGQVFKLADFTRPDGTSARVGLAQINISQDIKFDYETINKSINWFYQIIAENSDIDILFFPETSIPISWENLSLEEKQKFIEYARKYQTSLALGVFKVVSEDSEYNAIVGIDTLQEFDDLDTVPFYAKHHLVPFGEYKPLAFISKPIFKMLGIRFRELAKGPKHQSLIILGNQHVAFNICYEEGFGDELIELAKSSSLVANESNMAWYGSSYAMDLQLQQGQARAIELGRYVVRATNTGYSAILDNKGKIINYHPRDQFGVVTGKVLGYIGQTPYMRMGGSFYWIFSLFLLLLILFFYSHKKNKI